MEASGIVYVIVDGHPAVDVSVALSAQVFPLAMISPVFVATSKLVIG